VTDVAWVDVLPNMSRFAPALAKGTEGASAAAGLSAGKSFGKAMLAGIAVVAGGAALATKALYSIGETFDSMTDTIRVGTGATGDALKALADSAKNVGKNVPASFEDIGVAVADLNTRLGLTGKPLESMAGQFLELSRITGTDVASNISSMTRVFGDWDVAAQDQAGTLDELFRASQATGIGVDTLADKVVQFGAPLRGMGFDLAQSAALFGKFEKEGVNAELVIGALRQGLGRMAKAGEDAPATFRRVVDEISGMESRTKATATAMELFGARAGPDMAAAIQEGRFEIDGLLDTIVNGQDTITSAGQDTQDFAEKWLMFKNRVMVAVAPAAERLFSTIGDGMDWIATDGVPTARNFLATLEDWRPAILTVTGVMAGLVAVTAAHSALLAVQAVGGIAAWIAQTNIAQAVTKTWTAMQWLLNASFYGFPLVWIVVAIAALVAAIVIAYQKSETFRNIVQAAWAGIQTAIRFAWERVIKPALGALVWYYQNVLAPIVTWLWRNVFAPAFAGISFAVSVAWAAIRLIFDLWVWVIRNVLAPPILWLWNAVIKPAFTNIRDFISAVWTHHVKPVFEALGSFIRDKVAPAFGRGVELIKTLWAGIQEAARKPVNFIIDTVYNNGIKAVFDKIAKAVGSDARLPAMSLLAAAGSGKGGGAGKAVQARARGGWTPPGWTLVGEEGPELVDFRTPGRVYTAGQTDAFFHGMHPNGDGYGGPIEWLGNAGGWVLGKLRDMASSAFRWVTDRLGSVGGGTLGDLAGSAVRKAIEMVVGWAGKKDETEGTTAGGGKAVPGNGTGSLSSLLAFGRMMQSMGARVGEHPAFGGVRGRHMQGSKHHSARALDLNFGPGGQNATEMAFFDRIMRQGIPQSYGLRTLWRTPGHFDHMHVEYDRGGWLKPGMTPVINNTGKPEAVLTNAQASALQQLVRGEGVPPGPLDLSDDTIVKLAREIRTGSREIADSRIKTALRR
jgi:TP901 family phage tail tape measure protein